MQVQATPTTDFVHGSINARSGCVMSLEEGLARDLEAHGLVVIKGTRKPVPAPAPEPPARDPAMARLAGVRLKRA